MDKTVRARPSFLRPITAHRQRDAALELAAGVAWTTPGAVDEASSDISS